MRETPFRTARTLAHESGLIRSFLYMDPPAYEQGVFDRRGQVSACIFLIPKNIGICSTIPADFYCDTTHFARFGMILNKK